MNKTPKRSNQIAFSSTKKVKGCVYFFSRVLPRLFEENVPRTVLADLVKLFAWLGHNHTKDQYRPDAEGGEMNSSRGEKTVNLASILPTVSPDPYIGQLS
ncbi:hypothetical protein BaRGS_00014453 [Batillaria attramentaria]|uniref:Uncharacterized protein n=1 Tax=Batillaria attramentaria TaxID=370345 RepID=A0ABD0L5C4_9CAEN